MKKTLIALYYGLLILVLTSQAIYTVYRLGSTVGHGEKLGQLQQQLYSLNQELQLLRAEHSNATALTTVSQTAQDSYLPIQKPIILSVSDSVASR
jgi:hypothetical protein